jgi:hypothetical protein
MPFAGKVITRFAVGTLAELTGSCQVFTAFFSPSKPGKLIWGGCSIPRPNCLSTDRGEQDRK